MIVQPGGKLAEYLRIHLLLIKADDVVQNFIDQADRIDLPGLHRLLRESHQVAPLVHLLGKPAGSVEISENHVSTDRKEGLVELVAVTGLA